MCYHNNKGREIKSYYKLSDAIDFVSVAKKLVENGFDLGSSEIRDALDEYNTVEVSLTKNERELVSNLIMERIDSYENMALNAKDGFDKKLFSDTAKEWEAVLNKIKGLPSHLG